jgi:hypothetical protein
MMKPIREHSLLFAFPYWIKLVRGDDTLSGSHSVDGVN